MLTTNAFGWLSLVRRLEDNRAVDRNIKTLSVMSCNVHGICFCGLSVALFKSKFAVPVVNASLMLVCNSALDLE